MDGVKSFFTIDFNMREGAIRIANLDITKDQINRLTLKVLAICFALVAMYLAIKIGSKIIDKTVRKQGKFKFSLDDKKARTIGAVLKSILKYTVYFLGIGFILTEIFGTISLTLASIGGVAIGFGSQSLVKDVINGFFILFEDQFAVGDFINIDSKSGVVESIELRVTKLRDFNGDLHIIPNGMITQVTNHSRGDMRFLVDIDIAYEEDVDRAIAVLQTTCDNFKKNNENVVEGPKVLGVAALKEYAVTLRVVGKAKSMTQWDNESRLRRDIKIALDEAKIEIAYPKRKIIN
jgi:moderate conductance mechanosensitive channel